jgi:serine/threonine-protein kinase
MREPMMIARFDREAAILARLHHRNLINLIDVGETAARQKLMVLELARGESLATLIAGGPFDRARVVRLTMQLLRGLEHAHLGGLVHRDLKPDNVMVEHDDHAMEVPRIVDFGIAVLRGHDASVAGKRLTIAGTILGTPAYMAPEQAQGGDPDPRNDLFALGVIVYEMLAGKQPFDGTSMEIVMANISLDPPVMAQRTDVPVDPLLEAFARKLMARRLSERCASARAAIELLELIERDRDAAAVVLARSSLLPAEVSAVASDGAAAASRTAAEVGSASAPTVALPAIIPRSGAPRITSVLACLLLAIGGLAGWSLASLRTHPQDPVREPAVRLDT